MGEFNRGIYDYIIATDEVPELQTLATSGSRRRGHKRKRDKEYGVARGIDFQGTGCAVYNKTNLISRSNCVATEANLRLQI